MANDIHCMRRISTEDHPFEFVVRAICNEFGEQLTEQELLAYDAAVRDLDNLFDRISRLPILVSPTLWSPAFRFTYQGPVVGRMDRQQKMPVSFKRAAIVAAGVVHDPLAPTRISQLFVDAHLDRERSPLAQICELLQRMASTLETAAVAHSISGA